MLLFVISKPSKEKTKTPNPRPSVSPSPIPFQAKTPSPHSQLPHPNQHSAQLTHAPAALVVKSVSKSLAFPTSSPPQLHASCARLPHAQASPLLGVVFSLLERLQVHEPAGRWSVIISARTHYKGDLGRDGGLSRKTHCKNT